MELKSRVKNAKFFVRVFPSLHISHEDVVISADWKSLKVRSLQDFLPGRKRVVSHVSRFLNFQTNGVFHNVSQDEIYDKVMGVDLVEKVFGGMSAIVLGYGQTGTGKSFTINGMRNVYECRGLAPRLVSELFDVRNNKKQEIHVSFEISFIEIHGNRINDLLRNSFVNDLKNVTIYPLNSEKHGLEMLFNGEGRRVCGNASYCGANRAHSVMTVYITSKNMLYSSSPVHYGKIHLVDLAGIDTIGNETSRWKTGWDIGRANLTKSFLEQYLTSTNSKRQVVVNDLLIQYLGDVRNCVMRFVAHISGALADLELTISTLKFGAKVSGMKFEKVVVSNKEEHVQNVDTGLEKIRCFNERLELNAMLFDQPDWAVSEAKLCPARLGHLRRLAQSYIKGETSELQLLTVVQSTVSMKVFKEIYDQLLEERAPFVDEVENLRRAIQDATEFESLVSESSLKLSEKQKKKLSNSSTSVKKRRGSPTRKRRDSPISDQSSATRVKKTSKKSSKKSLKTPTESKPLMIDVEIPKVPQREIDKLGITIGPGIISHYQGANTIVEKMQRAQLAKEASKAEINVENIAVVPAEDVCATYRFINIIEQPVKLSINEEPEVIHDLEKKMSYLPSQISIRKQDKASNKKSTDKKTKGSQYNLGSRKGSIASIAGNKLGLKLPSIPDDIPEDRTPSPEPALPATPSPSLEPSWELFVQSGIKDKFQEEVDLSQKNAREAHVVYLKTISELQQCRRILSEKRKELEETQHQRHLSGNEHYDVEGRVITSEAEKNLIKYVRTKESEMDQIKIVLIQQRVLLNEFIARIDVTKKAMDEAYQEFRKAMGISQQSSERFNDEERMLLVPTDARMEHYNRLRDTRLGIECGATKLYGK